MYTAFVFLGVALFIIAIILWINRKYNILPHYKNNETDNTENEPTRLEVYNEIVGLRNQISWTNLWLFIICLILICKFVLPIVLKVLGITYLLNELNGFSI